MSDEKALTQLDIDIAEGKTQVWLACATTVACVAVLVGLPAISAVFIPSAVVGIRSSWRSWKRIRARRDKETQEFS